MDSFAQCHRCEVQQFATSNSVWCAVRSHPNMAEGDSSDMNVTHMVRQDLVHRIFMGQRRRPFYHLPISMQKGIPSRHSKQIFICYWSCILYRGLNLEVRVKEEGSAGCGTWLSVLVDRAISSHRAHWPRHAYRRASEVHGALCHLEQDSHAFTREY